MIRLKCEISKKKSNNYPTQNNEDNHKSYWSSVPFVGIYIRSNLNIYTFGKDHLAQNWNLSIN